MKRLQIFTLFVLTILSVYSKGYTGQVAFISNEVQEVNDSLRVFFKLNIRAGAVSDCDAMYITPQLLSNESIMEFPYILIAGNKKYNMIERWESLNKDHIEYDAPYMTFITEAKTDTLISYNVSVPYQSWMDSAYFVVKQEISGCRNQNRLFTFLLNNKVKLQPHTPYEVNTLVAYIEPQAELKIRKVQGQAYLDFQVGQSKILPNYRNNTEELAKINDVVSEVINNSDATIKSLFIEGYASPDGPYEVNDRLSYNRAMSLKNYIRDRYHLPDNMLKVSNVAEDWDGLKALLVGSNIPDQERIIDIIDNTGIFDGRETKLMKLAGGVPYKKMLRELFPQLRRVEYRIDFSVRDFSIAETKNLLGKKDAQLSQKELYLLAFDYGQGNKEFTDIMTEKILKYYPDDEIANNNAGATMLTFDELSLAKRYLLKAGTNPATLNNLGVLFLKEGQLDKAEEFFKKAIGNGSKEASHNLQELETKRKDNVKMERYKNNLSR